MYQSFQGMQRLTLTSNYNSGYYMSKNYNQACLDRDSNSPENSNSNSPINNSSDNKKEISEQIDNLSKNNSSLDVEESITSKMSKINSFKINLTNNENNLNKHNINNNFNLSKSISLMDNSIEQATKPLSKLRRFLTTLLQFANDVSPKCGERVHSIILGLMNSTYTVDEFQVKIQEVLNYPIRPFILPFLKSFLPTLQAEMTHLARISKLSLSQFVQQNEKIFLESSSLSNINNLQLNGNSLAELDELLLTTSVNNQPLKRRLSPGFICENENLNNSKRFHSNALSPSIKMNHQQINSNIKPNLNSTTESSTFNNNESGILHNHLTQARTAMLEELMSNRLYQTPIQQQFNLINQHLNQQISHGQKTKPLNNNLLLLSNSNEGENLSNSTISSFNNQLNNVQNNPSLNMNNILNLSSNKQFSNLERLALLERYEKELFLQAKQTNQMNNLRNLTETNYQNNQVSRNQMNLGQNISISNQQAQVNCLPKKKQVDSLNEEEWKNINTMLNCIIGMVEKTKRALNILQQRNQENNTELFSPTEWTRKNNQLKTITNAKNLVINKNSTPPIDKNNEFLDLRKTKDINLFSPLSTSMPKVNLIRMNGQSDLMSIEKTKMERILNDIRKQTAEDILATVNVQEDSSENCWNCGRKASETCSGCKQAKYCGSFCQHKDWETHHRLCVNKDKTSEINENNINKNLNIKTDFIDSPNSTPDNIKIKELNSVNENNKNLDEVSQETNETTNSDENSSNSISSTINLKPNDTNKNSDT